MLTVFLTAVIEQRVNIKFCVKLAKMSKETYKMLQTDCGNEALNRGSVLEWFKQFKDIHTHNINLQPICKCFKIKQQF